MVQESSKQRRSHLASLYEYMQSCSKELVYLSGQQERILYRDWSDRMADAPGIRMEYEVMADISLDITEIRMEVAGKEARSNFVCHPAVK